MVKNKYALAAAAAATVLATGIGIANADAFRTRVPGEFPLTQSFADVVTGGGVLTATLTLATWSGNLNIVSATSGFYNSQFQWACQFTQLDAVNRNWALGNSQGDVSRSCAAWQGPVAGVVGWIDDI